jgi:RNA polymerase subunit RPABC4/transcription elongation factor Spt4
MAKQGIKVRYNPVTGRVEMPLSRGIVGHLLTLRLFIQALCAHKLGEALRADCERVEPMLATVEREWRAKIKPGKKPLAPNPSVCLLRAYGDGQIVLPIDRAILVDRDKGAFYQVLPFLRDGGYEEARELLVRIRCMLTGLRCDTTGKWLSEHAGQPEPLIVGAPSDPATEDSEDSATEDSDSATEDSDN